MDMRVCRLPAVRRGMAQRSVVRARQHALLRLCTAASRFCPIATWVLVVATQLRAATAHPPPPLCSLQDVEIAPGVHGLRIILPESTNTRPLCTLDPELWKEYNFRHRDDVELNISSHTIAATDRHDSGVAAILCINQHDYQHSKAVDSDHISNVLKDESDLKRFPDVDTDKIDYNNYLEEQFDLKDQLEVLKTNEKIKFSKIPKIDDVVLNFNEYNIVNSGKSLDNEIESLQNNMIVNDDVYKYEIVDDPVINKKNEWESYTKDWRDLSRDIKVNYPSRDRILDVEGVNVQKNIFNFDDRSGIADGGIESMDETVDHYSDTLIDENYTDKPINVRFKREVTVSAVNSNTETQTLSNTQANPTQQSPLRIRSLRIDRSSREISMTDEGVPELLGGSTVTIRIFGESINEDTQISFTKIKGVYGDFCEYPDTKFAEVVKGSLSEKSALVDVTMPSGTDKQTYYLCAKNSHKSEADNTTKEHFIHQGVDTWLQLYTFETFLPLWASIGIIGVCLFFSALFSGLNLGLMSLDRTELKILCNTGTEKEKEYARVIQPVRDHGNYLLCSILLGNVAVNSTFTILLDSLTSGVVAVISSTLLIVLLGEITPQAICSRHGLAVGAKTIHITKAVMGLTFPLSYPVSKLLDVLLGEEIGNVYNRERLKELVKVTNDINDLDKDEVNIISGALELHKKTVSEVMTKIEDVFMLDYEAVLDFETVSEIMKTGFSRIPVYEGTRTNIVAMLYIKDLVFIDPDDNTPLKTLCQFYQNPCNFLFDDVTLDVIFKQFKEGHKGHMAFVQHVNSEGDGDPFYETIGLVTLEDVIEELIQAEIVDETDVFTDNKSKRRRNRPINKLQDFGVFAERRENQRIRISPQLTLATFQYLSTSVDAFKPDVVSETILRRLLKQDIIHHIKYRGKERPKNDPSLIIFEQGKSVDYFVLILEGRVEVTVGRENLVFESGPFTYFGSQALTQNIGFSDVSAAPSTLGSLQSINMESMLRQTFIPDYSVRAVTEVFYISIKKSLYLAAKRATLMQKCAGHRSKGIDDANDQFDDEVEKLLHSLEEELSPMELATSPHVTAAYQVSPSGPNGSTKKSQESLDRTSHPPVEQSSEPVPHESSALLPS